MVGGGEEVVVENLAVGGLAPLKAVVVDGAPQRIFRHGVVGVVGLSSKRIEKRGEKKEEQTCANHKRREVFS